MQRRSVLKAALAGVAATTLGMLTPRQARAATAAKVVVVGGGFGGATAARYLRTWSRGAVDVTLIEPDEAFVSCPLSNLVVAGYRQMADITLPYDTLVSRHGVKHVRDTVRAIDPAARTVRLAGGGTLPYDRLILSPGVEMQSARSRVWRVLAGIRSCTPGRPVRRPTCCAASLRRCPMAVRSRSRSRWRRTVARPGRTSGPAWLPTISSNTSRAARCSCSTRTRTSRRRALFRKVWETRYKGMIEYRPQFETVDVDPATRTIRFDVQDDERADVINLLPPQRAGAIAVASGLATANGRWCEVDFLTMASTVAPDIHVLGDAVQIAPLMPKSGTMANQHGKVAAAAILRLLAGQDPDPEPVYTNTCYSFTSSNEAIHVASVHRYDAGEKTMLTVPGSGGLSVAPSRREGEYGLAWAHSIWADMLGA
jgi:NADPH-dependent 2,4-dienoyl-CoA reductase/sulfur reductase-like enzyme